jgi:hypothetical protein
MKVSHFDVPLQNGLKLRIKESAVNYSGAKPVEPAEFLHCEVLRWEYQIADSESASLEVVVEDFDAPTISNNRAFTAIGLAVVTCMVLGLQVYVFLQNPDEMWAFVGNYARWAGLVVLLILFLGVIPWRMGLRKRAGFRELYLSAILCWTGIALVLMWWSFTRPSTSSEDAVVLGKAIAAKLKADNWPLLLAALPWAALVFKLLGFDVAEKTAGVVIDAAKTKE